MTNHSPIIRSATLEDIEQYYGKPLGNSVRAIVADLDGKILGVAGMAYHKDQMLAFSKMDDEMKAYPFTIMRAARKFAKMARKYGKNVLAVAACYEKNSDAFLRRVGFEFIGETSEGRVYKWIR